MWQWFSTTPPATIASSAQSTMPVARWREENPLDVVRIIRGIRAEEGH
jgi:hypothetical protein